MQVVTPASPGESAGPDELHSKILSAARRLRDRVGLSFVWELAAAYLGDAPRTARSLRALRAAGRPREFARLAHSLKGNSRMFGLDSIEEICATLEQAGKTSTLGIIEPLLDVLDAELAAACVAVERCCFTNLRSPAPQKRTGTGANKKS